MTAVDWVSWISFGVGLVALAFLVVGFVFLWKVRKDLNADPDPLPTGRSGYYDDPRSFTDDAHTGWEESPPVP